MNKNWMNKLLLAVFLITMVTPVPVQAKAITDQVVDLPVQNAVGVDMAPIAIGTPVPVMAVRDTVDSAPVPVQLDAPSAMNSGVAAPAQVGTGYVDDYSGDITWTGSWSTLDSGNALGGQYKASTTLNSTASLEFTGSQISLIFAKAPGRGSLQIRIDGTLVTTLAMADPAEQWQVRWDSPYSV